MKLRTLKRLWHQVKWILVVQVIGVAFSAICAGCATKGYIGDRMHDAGDIFTATVGLGAGGKARVGPLQVGLLINGEIGGVRCGECSLLFPGEIVGPVETLPIYPYRGRDGFFKNVVPAEHNIPLQRGKAFVASTHRYVPFVATADQAEYYTQIEAVIALGVSIRLGFNPGELMDFILGWTTIDIYGDDIEWKKSNKTTGE